MLGFIPALCGLTKFATRILSSRVRPSRYRPNKKPLFKLSLIAFFSLSCLVSCGAGGSKEAQHDASLFYRAVKAESRYDRALAAGLFEAALDSPSSKTRREAARRLAWLLPEAAGTPQEQAKTADGILDRLKKTGKNAKKQPEKAKDLEDPAFILLNASALYVKEKYKDAAALLADKRLVTEPSAGNPAGEADSLYLLSLWAANSPDRTETLRDFFYGPRIAEGNAAQRELFEQTLSRMKAVPKAPSLEAVDDRAIAGRLALSRNDYDGALLCFDEARALDESLFFRCQGLLSDLGRAYQGTTSRRAEGLDLFTRWLDGPDRPEPAPDRYTLLFYSGRICRQQNKHSQAIDFFTRALGLAPDERQQDACIWYILNTALASNPDTAVPLVKTYALRWNRDAGFADVLDRLCAHLVSRRRWTDIAEILDLIKDKGAIAAQYAYIMGRACGEGYIRGDAAAYFNTAFEEGNGSFYYRALAASYLDKAVVPEAGFSAAGSAQAADDMLSFYLGFFDYNAEDSLLPFLRRDMDGMSEAQLRAIAAKLAERGRYIDSINLARSYMARENYRMEKADLELYYPRAFTDLIEAEARSAGLDIPLFFGLIRTESAFMPEIVSRAGAVGLAQVMPATAREVNATIKRRGGPDFEENGYIDLRNPTVNVRLGAVYLSGLYRSMGSPMLALLAYNGGPARVRSLRRAAASFPEDLFLETIANNENRGYGKRVMAAAAAYGYLYYGLSMEAVVADIFK
jgi:soluble lytic murein transglycosylase